MLAGILIAVFYVVPEPSDALSGFFSVIRGPFGDGWVVAFALATPFAAYLLGRPHRDAPALTSLMALMQLVFLVGFGAVVTLGSSSATSLEVFKSIVTPSSGPAVGADSAAWIQYQAFKSIAMPALGAMVAALIYLCPTPWRAGAIISVDAITRIAMGFVVAWGALVAGGALVEEGDPVAHAAAASTILWILAVPLFELVYRLLIAPSPFAASLPPHRSASMLVSMALAGAIGAVVWHWRLAGIWSEVAMVLALFAYLLAPRFIFQRMPSQQQSGIVGPPSHAAR